jgi:hypothetical protein
VIVLAGREERPALLEERLEGRQVDLGRVGFDLPEVGVDGRVQREVRPQAHPEVQAYPGVHVPSVLKRVVLVEQCLARERRRAGHVGHELDPPG